MTTVRARTAAAVGQLDPQRPVAPGASQSSPPTSAGISDLGAELLRLHERAARQRLAGDAGGKAEIVLDARARAGLAAEGARIEHHHGEAFGGGVHRGGEPRRPGADDG